MEYVNLYYLLPESDPTNQWMKSNYCLQDEEKIVQYMRELENIQECIRLENYCGYYDRDNINNFLQDFNTLEEYYPQPVFKLMRIKMQRWNNWRGSPVQISNNNYTLYSQKVSDHTFSEVSEHQHQCEKHNFVLVNHRAHKCSSPIEVTINDNIKIKTSSVENASELFEWFAENRLPVRNFQIIEKHGECRTEFQLWNGKQASPLRCTRDQAFELLKRAVGDKAKELYNIDYERGNYYIVFKHEGDTPENMYHGYHVALNSKEVPNHIKQRLQD